MSKHSISVKLAALALALFMLVLPSCGQNAPAATTAADTETAERLTEKASDTESTATDETETEAATEEPYVPPYDDTHAYLFADNRKQTKWATSGAEVSKEFNVLKMVPTNHDPMIYCSFAESERFDSQEYPFVAYRYSVKSTYNQGVFFVTSENHPSFSDDGLTWINVSNRGAWTNVITDMRKNAFWEGVITAFRIDPINGGALDKKAVIYLDRVGFFKTEEDAQAFLDDASGPDYSESVTFSKDFAKAVLPGNTLSDGYNSADYLMIQSAAVEIKDGVTPVVVRKADGKETVVPVSYVNSVGFVTYLASAAGEYSLSYPDKKVETDADFVTVRGVMTEADLKAEKITKDRATAILFGVFEEILPPANTDDLKDPADAEFTAQLIGSLLKRSDLSVHTDKTLSVKGLSDAENLAVCSGVITDINAKTLSGAEFASIVTRLIKAMLGQPVLKSNITDKDGITIGAWSHFNFKINEDTVKTFADAGLSLLINLGDLEQADIMRTVLNDGRKYGVKLIRYNYSPVKFNASRPDPIPASCYEYYDYDSYLGNMIYDEPGSDEYGRMASLTEFYNASLPGKLCYYNLLPMYANAAQLKYGANAAQIAYYDSDPELYKKYVEAYAEAVKGDYMCVDIYPYRSSGKTKKIYTEYLKNMDIFASECRKYDRDFWLYIQSTDYDGGSWIPNYSDLRWQMYVGLSFGVKTFLHFVYSWNNSYGLVVDGKTTEIYDAAKKADFEILAISDDYAKYKNVGAFNKNCGQTKFAYAQFDNQYDGFSVIKEIRSDDPLLFGCFEEKDGDGYAFTAVNMNNVNKNTKAGFSFTLDGDYKVTVWKNGEKTALEKVNGEYSVSLDIAEGVFVMIER